MWTGTLLLKNTTAVMKMHFVSGCYDVAKGALPNGPDGTLIRIVQRMRLEPVQLEGVARKMTVSSNFYLLGKLCVFVIIVLYLYLACCQQI